MPFELVIPKAYAHVQELLSWPILPREYDASLSQTVSGIVDHLQRTIEVGMETLQCLLRRRNPNNGNISALKTNQTDLQCHTDRTASDYIDRTDKYALLVVEGLEAA